MATCSSILVWKIPWTEELGGGVGAIVHGLAKSQTWLSTHTHTHTHTHTLTQFSLSKVGKLSPGDLCPILLLCYTGTRSMVLQVSLKFLNCCLNNAAPCIFWSQAEDVGKEGKRKESRAACFSLNLHQVPCRYPFMVVKLERNHFSRSPISPEAGV